MIPTGGLYVAVVTVLLLVALGVAVPVLKRIVIDGIERQRTGEATLRTDPEDSPPEATTPADRDDHHARCSDCGTPNAPEFTYCRECGQRL